MDPEAREMKWKVKAGGREFTFETRDKRELASDVNDDTERVGAIGEIPHRDPIMLDFAQCREIKEREAMAPMDSWLESREVTHRRAIESLCDANGWTNDRGEAVFEAERIA